MNRLVIVVAIAIVIVIAGLIIFLVPWDGDPPRPPQPKETTEIDDNPSEVRRPKELQIVQPTPLTQSETGTVSVSINAIPWARVFIQLPENNYFMEPRTRDFTIPLEPNEKNANVTPIPGDLKVPIGTTIKLMYRGNEKIFPYEVWKDGKTISHDFLNQ
ncbi:hypothetical protein J4G02_15985 [Candidatus Poribacteria bacterium]|nr:hypothetical protein [Candidatus Poribacteria bacterium]